MVKKQLYDSTKVANAHFRPEDRNKNDDLSSAVDLILDLVCYGFVVVVFF